MKPIYNTGDKVYLTEEDDFNDYEIIEITLENDHEMVEATDNFRYKIRPVNGDRVVIKSETEIFPITA